MTRIVVHIDRLVLTGIDRNDAATVAAGMQAELQRLLAEPGINRALTDTGHRLRIRVGAVPVAPGTTAQAMGRAIAGGVAQGMRP